MRRGTAHECEHLFSDSDPHVSCPQCRPCSKGEPCKFCLLVPLSSPFVVPKCPVSGQATRPSGKARGRPTPGTSTVVSPGVSGPIPAAASNMVHTQHRGRSTDVALVLITTISLSLQPSRYGLDWALVVWHMGSHAQASTRACSLGLLVGETISLHNDARACLQSLIWSRSHILCDGLRAQGGKHVL